MWSPDTTGFRRRACSHPVFMNIQIPHSAFSDTTSVGSWGAFLACEGWKSRCFTQPAVSVEVGPQLFLWCLVWTQQLLYKRFLSCWAVPFQILWLEKADIWGNFFCQAHIGVFRLPASPVSSLRYMRQKEHPGNKVPKQTSLFSLPIRVFFCVFYV